MYRRLISAAATAAVTLAVGAAAGCGASGATAGGGTSGATAGGGKPQLTITSPQDGATVRVPFTLRFRSSVPLGPTDSGRDHVHVFTDGHSDNYTVVPATSFEIKNLAPGRHTIGVTLQHADHSPAGASAQVTVVVTGSGGPAPTSGSGNGGGGGYGY